MVDVVGFIANWRTEEMEIRKYYEPMNQERVRVWRRVAVIASPVELVAVIVCMQVIVAALYFSITGGV